MNGPGDIPLTLSTTPDTRPCSLIAIIPTLGMSSCRGRAEAFARRLSSKLRTLGSQTDDEPTSPEEDEPIINGVSTNTWVTSHESEQTVTDLQPLRNESDSFFDFDCELESPGSPVDECEYLRLIETASNTPHNNSAAESGYVCASAASSHSSTDGPYFDVVNTESSATKKLPTRSAFATTELPDYVNSLKFNGSDDRLSNHVDEHAEEESSETLSHNDSNLESAKSKQKSEKTPALPTTGPDVAASATDTATNTETANESESSAKQADPTDKELTVKEMVQMQDQIISELQKQSENFIELDTTVTAAIENTQNDSQSKTETTTLPEASAETMATATTAPEMVPPSFTNGHSENENEEIVLESTMTEGEKHSPTESTAADSALTKETPVDDDDVATSAQSNEPTVKTTKAKESLSTLDTTDDEDECRPQRVRRCSSLKTGKTPPGTPGRKKIVRFADVLGLDLADVKTFLDEIPTIPKSAFEDLEIMEAEPPIQLGPKSDKLLMPLFQQPGGHATFLDIVREKQVSLENAAVTDHINQTINGSVRVRNLDFNKSVHIRYSLDGWRSFADLQANYVENSCDGFSDKFTFVIFGNSLHIGQRLEFAVRFQCKGQQFWDNNYGTNYCFQCLPTSTPSINPIQPIVPTHTPSHHHAGLLSPNAGEAWCSSFY